MKTVSIYIYNYPRGATPYFIISYIHECNFRTLSKGCNSIFYKLVYLRIAILEHNIRGANPYFIKYIHKCILGTQYKGSSSV